MQTGERQKWRARFAMWVLGLISPWLSLWEEPPPDDDGYRDTSDAAYDAGIEHGYRQAMEDHERRDW